MTPRQLTLTPKAREDLDAIWTYSLQTWGRARAETYVRLLGKAFDDLARGVSLGRSADEVRSGYFRHSVGSHVVFYRYPDTHVLEVVRILHQRMDIPRHF
ncbi:type II toxin-antitoxin system RelE/ParE family toxin [Xanthobacter autotrophicus]|uniref:type II toxin-antitoxin system RelE/ParE family toxin n=1 Tax=Xanthobacter autotrophicus TaxID=280 RepID=UPI00372B8435